MEAKILTRHPEGKRGVNISRAKYDVVRAAILAGLRGKELTFAELSRIIQRKLQGKFDGSLMGHYTSVKLDLEARRELERVPGSRPQRLRLRKTTR